MEETKPNEVHYIPKDAKIPIEVGAGYLERLHKMLIFFINGKTQEELAEFKKLLESNTIPEDTWMYHYQTIQLLVLMLEDIAVKKKITAIKNIDNIN